MCGKIGCVCVDICLCGIYTHNITVTMAKMLINTIVYYKMYISMRLFVTCVCVCACVHVYVCKTPGKT